VLSITPANSTRPKDAQNWANGKALLATGSPFDPVPLPDSDKEYIVGECNNVGLFEKYIFADLRR